MSMRLDAQDEKALAERRQRAKRRSRVRREQTAKYLRRVADEVQAGPQQAMRLLGQPEILDEAERFAGQPDIPPEVDDGPERCA